MKLAVQRTSAAIAVFAGAGVSGLFFGTAPATAVAPPCGTGTLISGTICEQTFTSTTATNFTPPAHTTKLEALLVGGGGGGNVIATSPSSSGYAVGGGGGQVKIVNFTNKVGSATPLVVTAGEGGTGGEDGSPSTITGGPSANANGGNAGDGTDHVGGSSGSHTGASISDSGTPPTYYGGGAGAGGSTTTLDGGVGVTVSTSFSSNSLFGSDTACYGGGGAATQSPDVGTATCGGDNPPDSDPAATSYPAVNANTGGGGAASFSVTPTAMGVGSDGIVVFRWFATNRLTFSANGHGKAPAGEDVVLGAAPKRPAAPKATGYVFGGWYTDAALTTPADFSVPLTESTTFYAKWDPSLATTGGAPNQAELPIAIGTLAVGAALVGTALYRRKRKAS